MSGVDPTIGEPPRIPQPDNDRDRDVSAQSQQTNGEGMSDEDALEQLAPYLSMLPREWSRVHGSDTAMLAVMGMIQSPRLGNSLGAMSVEDLTDFLNGVVLGKLNKSAEQTARTQLTTARRLQTEQHKLQQVKHEELMRDLAATHKNDNASEALKWFKRIAMPLATVLSVALAVGTAGLATPLAVMAIGMCCYGMAQHINEEYCADKGVNLSMADGLAKGFKLMYMELGDMSEEDAEKAAMLTSGAVVVAIAVASMLANPASNPSSKMKMAMYGLKSVAPMLIAMDAKFVGNMAGGAAMYATDDENTINGVMMGFTLATQLLTAVVMLKASTSAGKDLKGTAATLATIGGVLGASLAVANGVTGATKGALDIETTLLKNDADLSQADLQRVKAQAKLLQQFHDQIVELIKKSLEDWDKNVETLSDIEKDTSQANQAILNAI